MWASGTVGKTLTCKAMGGPHFVMSKHIAQRIKRDPKQIEQQQIFKRKMILAGHTVEMGRMQSAISGEMTSGIGISGVGEPIVFPLPSIPPFPFIPE